MWTSIFGSEDVSTSTTNGSLDPIYSRSNSESQVPPNDQDESPMGMLLKRLNRLMIQVGEHEFEKKILVENMEKERLRNEEKLKSLSNTIEDLKDQNIQLQYKLEYTTEPMLMESLQDITDMRDALLHVKKQLENEIDEKQHEKEKLQDQLERKEKIMECLIGTFHKDLHKIKNLYQDTKANVSEMQNEIRELMSSALETVKTLEHQVHTQKLEIHEYTRQNEQLKDQLEGATFQVTELNTAITDYKSDCMEMWKENEALKQNLQKQQELQESIMQDFTKNQVIELEEMKLELMKKVESLEAEKQELETILISKDKEIESLKEDVNTLVETNELSNSKPKEIDEQPWKESTFRVLTSQVAAAQAELAEAMELNLHLNNRNVYLEDQVAELTTKNRKSPRQSMAENEEIARLQEQLTTLSKQLEEVELHRQQWEIRSGEWEVKCQEWEEWTQQVTLRAETAETNVTKAEQALQNVELRLSDSQIEVETSQKLLAETQAALELSKQHNQTAQISIETLENTIESQKVIMASHNDTNSRIENLKMQLDESQQTLLVMEKKYRESQFSLEVMQEQMMELEDAKSELTQQVEDLVIKLKESGLEQNQSKLSMESERVKLETLETELRTINEAYKRIVDEKSALELNYITMKNDMQEEINALQASKLQLEMSLSAIQQDLVKARELTQSELEQAHAIFEQERKSLLEKHVAVESSLQNEKQNFEKQLNLLQTKLSEGNTQTDSLRQEFETDKLKLLNEHATEINRLQDELHQQKCLAVDVEAKYEASATEKSNLISQLQMEIQALKLEVQRLEAVEVTLSSQYNEVSNKYMSVNATLESINDEKKLMLTTISTLQMQLAVFESQQDEVSRLNAEKLDITGKLESLSVEMESRLQQWHEEKLILESSLSNVNAELESTRSDANSKIEELKAGITSHVQKFQTEKKSLEMVIEKLQKEKSSFESQRQHFESKWKEAESTNAKLEETCKEMEAALAKSKELFENLVAQTEQATIAHREEIETLHKAREALVACQLDQEQIIDDLHSEVNELQAEKNILSARAHRLGAQLSEFVEFAKEEEIQRASGGSTLPDDLAYHDEIADDGPDLWELLSSGMEKLKADLELAGQYAESMDDGDTSTTIET